MGVTPQPARVARPCTTIDSGPPRRMSVREARVRCVERDGRLLIAWRTDRTTDQRALREDFRATFPTHGAATWRPKESVWSVPLRLRDRLAEWVSARFAPGCELGYLPWDET
ncbi:MAG: hypothetical protein M3Y74_22665, partial [Chloroflexota bacterium]|nr:hypothetical protein [Chloroflexota bacterium]